eukprot:TRINITY_DN1881_c0_g2_i3.p1 TRINITY_DN1881_c0_g2~~TRINITY_DN1881_c0_g2_i3.p1  ORF type:complete len:374 (-),score=129.39 TRINITY_DN1881_c0_g2_i3:1074-2195(-)
MDEKQLKIEEFAMITGVDEPTAKRVMEANGYQHEMAIAQYFDNPDLLPGLKPMIGGSIHSDPVPLGSVLDYFACNLSDFKGFKAGPLEDDVLATFPDYAFKGSLEDAAILAREQSKYLMINVQDMGTINSIALNTVFAEESIASFIQENFVLVQIMNSRYSSSTPSLSFYSFPSHTHTLFPPFSPEGMTYLSWCSTSEFPHIAIIHPKTGLKKRTFQGGVIKDEFVKDCMPFPPSPPFPSPLHHPSPFPSPPVSTFLQFNSVDEDEQEFAGEYDEAFDAFDENDADYLAAIQASMNDTPNAGDATATQTQSDGGDSSAVLGDFVPQGNELVLVGTAIDGADETTNDDPKKDDGKETPKPVDDDSDDDDLTIRF